MNAITLRIGAALVSALAFALSAEVRTVHDWLDTTTSGVNVNLRFTIWKGDTSFVEFTSPPPPVPSRRAFPKSGLRLS